MPQTPSQTARATWQDLYALGHGFAFNQPDYCYDSIYSGASSLLLNEHPHIASGQTTIEKEKTTGASEGLAGTGFEIQQGHRVPTVSVAFDATAHNAAQFLKAFFHNGYEPIDGRLHATQYNSTGYHAVFHRYTNPNPTNFLTLVRKFSDSSANSHRMYGAIVSSIGFSANENETLTLTAELMGRDVSYTYTWDATGGVRGADTAGFDTSLDPLLWKNAHVAIGTIFEGYHGATAAISSSDITFSGCPDMTTVIEPGSYIVFKANPTVKYKIVDVSSSSAKIEGSATVSASSSFKIINALHVSGINFTLNNNAAAKAYDEASIERFVLGRISGEGTINIPFSEISTGTAGDGTVGDIADVGFTGSNWLKLFLEGGIVRLHIWWGDFYDAVEDSISDGDLGISLNIRATGDGIEDENGEMAVSVPFTIRGHRYTLGKVTNKVAGTPGAVNGFYGVSGSADWIATGAEILTTNPEIGIHRGDTIKSGSASSEIRYVASPTYLYTWHYLTTLSGVTAAGYTIEGDSVRIKIGHGMWGLDHNNQ